MGGVWKRVVEVVWLIIIIERCCEGEGCLEQERSALLQLKPFFNSPELRHLVNYSADCCRWQWVYCSNTNSTGRVAVIFLGGIQRESTEKWYLNASLFTPFPQLEYLSLRGNNITGFVENESLSGLSNLQTLDLSDNYFNNSILLSLGGLSSLRELDLSGNSLKGSIDVKGQETLSGLSNLEYLYLSYNYFNNSILSSLGGLSSLRRLSLSHNNLKGSIEVKGLRKLKHLDLSGNNLNRSSISLTGLSSLRVLDLSANGMKGSFDVKELDSLNKLEELYIGYNEIDNLLVPKDYKGLRKLRSLDLSSVKIRDARKLLQSLGLFPSLNILNLGYNNFTGRETTTYELRNFTNLEELKLEGSTLHISLLQSIAAFTSLKRLSMTGCILNGVLHGQGFLNFNKLEHLQMDITRVALNSSFLQIISESMASLKYLSLSYSSLNNNTVLHQGLCRLVHLQELYISSCNLRGNLPRCLANMISLQVLDVSHNQLVGDISLSPLVHLTSIQELSLSNNQFQIPISLEPFFNLSKLKIFDGGSNELYAETESRSLVPKFQLHAISLSGYGNSGTFPKFLYHQRELHVVDISHINLMGEFPNWLLENNTELSRVILQNNSLSGPLHMPIHPHKQLQILDVSNNNFQGNIPEKIGVYLPNLGRLQLDDNHFIGEIPENLSNCSLLGGLYLSNNNISGKIPTWFGNLSFLEDIIIPNNHLKGPIPEEFCQLHLLQILDLSENNISGSLPSCFSPYSIKQVHLSKNMLRGPLKDGTFYNSSFLVTLDLSYNRLDGNIPHWIEKLIQLSYLILANNNFEGEVPNQLCQLKQLRLIDLSHNNLSGQIPPCLDNTTLHEGYYDYSASVFIHLLYSHNYNGYSMGKEETVAFTTKERSYSYKGKPLNNMYGIDLSCNKLTGEIPPQIGDLTRIHALNLSHNNLTGTIPTTFSNLKQVESLDLSYNLLNGKIPPQLIDLNALAVFSVAHNNLSGKIPEWTAQFATFNESSYKENPFLCGLPLNTSCNANGSSPVKEDSTGNEEEDCLIDMESFYITFTVSYVIVILGIVGVLWVNPYWRRRWFYVVEMWMTSCYYFVLDKIIPTRFCH